jgi:hypothetical protein
MNIPSVPADNFYKFLAIGSLLSIIILIYSVFAELTEITEKTYQLKEEANLLLFDIQKSKSNIHYIQLLAKKACLECKCPCGNPKLNIDSLNVIYPDSSKYTAEIESLLKESNNQSAQLLRNSISLNNKRGLVKYYDDQLNFYLVLFFTGLIVLLFVMFFSFDNWYNKVQYIQDEMLKAEFHQKQIYINCQSCNTDLTLTPRGLEGDNKENPKYCLHCYNGGKFIEDLTLKEMKQKITRRLKELKYNWLERYIYIRKIKNLDRWRIKFIW